MNKIKVLLMIMLTCSLLTSCYYDDTAIKDAFDEYIEKQDSINIKTSQEQSDAMLETLQLLEDLEVAIRAYIDDSLSVEFQNEIDSLNSLIVELQNADDSICSWVSNTYATLEQYEELSNLLSLAKNELLEDMANMDSTIRADINTNLFALESSMKDWVSNQLKGYYTITEIDSLLQIERTNTADLIGALDSVMDAKMDSINTALHDSIESMNRSLLDSITILQNAILDNQIEIDSLRAQITREYQIAIIEAIEEYDGEIKGYIKNQVDSINAELNIIIDDIEKDVQTIKGDIDELKENLDKIEGRLSNLETSLENLSKQIQSVTYLPQYTDGTVQIFRSISKIDTIWNSYTDTIKTVNGEDSIYIPHKELERVDTIFEFSCEPIEFLITPIICADAITEQMLSVRLLNQKQRVSSSINLQLNSSFALELTAKDSQSGIIQIKLKDSEELRNWYNSKALTSLALFVDDEETKTHISSGFVVELIRKDDF